MPGEGLMQGEGHARLCEELPVIKVIQQTGESRAAIVTA